jgi:hypothetical protein
MFPFLPKRFHILEIVPITDHRCQADNQNIFQFMPQVPPLPPGVCYPFQFSFSFPMSILLSSEYGPSPFSFVKK